MGVAEQVDILVLWWQNLNLLLRQNVHWPSFIRDIRSVVQTFTRASVDDFPLKLGKMYHMKLEFRVQYIVFNIALPLLITLITLLLYKNSFVVIWYFSLLVGVTSLSMGIVGFIFPNSNFEKSQGLTISKLHVSTEVALCTAGIIVICICIVFGLLSLIPRRKAIRKWFKTKRLPPPKNREMDENDISSPGSQISLRERDAYSDSDTESHEVEEEDERDYVNGHPSIGVKDAREINSMFPILRGFRSLIIMTVCIATGLFLTGAVQAKHFKAKKSNFFDRAVSHSKFTIAFKIIGGFLFFYGLLCFLYAFIIMVHKGRLMSYFLMRFLRKHALKLIFFLLIALYSPINQNIIQVFMCRRLICPGGTHMPDSNTGQMLLSGWKNSTVAFCTPCRFHKNNKCLLKHELCPASADYRLFTDPTISCNKDLIPYFWPASVLLLVVYTLGVPVLITILTTKGAQRLSKMKVDHLLRRNQGVPEEPDTSSKSSESRRITVREQQSPDSPSSQSEFDQVDFSKRRTSTTQLVSSYYNFKKLKELQLKQIQLEDNEKWIIRTSMTNNPLKSLYQCYSFRWRYYKVVSTLARLPLAFFLVLMVPLPQATPSLFMGVNLISGIIVAAVRPYSFIGESVFSMLTFFANVLAGLFALVSYYANLPFYLYYVFLGVNGLVPLVFIIVVVITGVIWYRRSRFYPRMQMRLQLDRDFTVRNEVNWELIQRNHTKVDNELTEISLRYISYYFLLLGFVVFVCLAVTGIGLIYGSRGPVAVSPTPVVFEGDSTCEKSLANEFVGYETWQEFTNNCCCQQGDESDIELWRCRNKKMKERIRSVHVNGQDLSGYHMRSFCSPTFNFGYNLVMCGVPAHSAKIRFFNYLTNATYNDLPDEGTNSRIEMLNLW